MPAYFQIGHVAALVGASLARGEQALKKYLTYRPKEDEPARPSRPAPRVSLATVLAKPSDFTKQMIVTEGVVEKVCWLAGCWMKVAPEAGKTGIRVTFKNFVVPRDSSGSKVRLLGTVKLTENKLSFVAAGVELARSSK